MFLGRLAGLYQGSKKRRFVVMETVCDEDLYIRRMAFVSPGSHNDFNF